MKLKQASAVSRGKEQPNAFEVATAFECLDQVAQQFGRYLPLLLPLRDRLLRAIYLDLPPTSPPTSAPLRMGANGLDGAEGAAKPAPMLRHATYFEALRQERKERAGLEATLRRWEVQHGEELEDTQRRQEQLTETLELLKEVVLQAQQGGLLAAGAVPDTEARAHTEARGAAESDPLRRRLAGLLQRASEVIGRVDEEAQARLLEKSVLGGRTHAMPRSARLGLLRGLLDECGPGMLKGLSQRERLRLVKTLWSRLAEEERGALLSGLLAAEASASSHESRPPPADLAQPERGTVLGNAASLLDATAALDHLRAVAATCWGHAQRPGKERAAEDERLAPLLEAVLAALPPPARVPCLVGALQLDCVLRSAELEKVVASLGGGAPGARGPPTWPSPARPEPPPPPALAPPLDQIHSLFGVAVPPHAWSNGDGDGGGGGGGGAELLHARHLVCGVYDDLLRLLGGPPPASLPIDAAAERAAAAAALGSRGLLKFASDSLVRRSGLRSIGVEELQLLVRVAEEAAAEGRPARQLVCFGEICGLGAHTGSGSGDASCATRRERRDAGHRETAVPWATCKVAFFFAVLRRCLGSARELSLSALAARDDRALYVPLACCRMLATAFLEGSDGPCRLLVCALQQLSATSAPPRTTASASLEPSYAAAAAAAAADLVALEDVLPLFAQAFEAASAFGERRLRSAVEVFPTSGLSVSMTLERFEELLREVPGGASIGEARLVELYLEGLAVSDKLRGGEPSDVMLPDGFVHACRSAGLSRLP